MKYLINKLSQFKQWLLSIVRFRLCRITNETEKSKMIKSLFKTYFDGCYGVDAEVNVPNTYVMGLCKLDYKDNNNTLTVHLRRPGLLIGKQGKLIKEVENYLKCKIDIIEVVKF